jgi:hypothetical protein
MDIQSQVLFKKLNDIKPETEKEIHLYNLLKNDSTTIEMSFVEIDFEKLKNKDFSFYIDDKTYTLKDYRIETRRNNSFSVFANTADTFGHIYLTILDGDILGNIRIEYQYYELKTIGKGKYVLRKYDQLKYPNDCEQIEKRKPSESDPKPDTASSNQKINHNPNVLPNSNNSFIQKMAPTISQTCNLRIMICYTPAVAANVNNPINLCQQSIDLLNQTFINSGINHTAELAYAGEVNYVENGKNEDDINRFGDPNDGIMDEIHQIRDDYSADIGVILSTSSMGGTIGGVTPGTYVDASHAFCQVEFNSAINNFSFPHEIGHVLGAHHQGVNIPAFTDNHGYWTITATSHFWPFLHYWGIRSIMATIIQNTFWSYYNIVRLPYWSNPNTFINWNGLRQFGSNSIENNSRVLNESIKDAKTFRQSTNELIIDNQIYSNNTGSHIAQNITTNGLIQVKSGANEKFQAGKSVTLTNGFHAESGSEFHAKIEPIDNCLGNPSAGGINNGGTIKVNWDEVINLNLKNSHLNVFPNPTDGIVDILYEVKNQSEIIKVVIVDSKGLVIQTLNNLPNDLGKNSIKFNFNNFANGVYYIHLKQGESDGFIKVLYNSIK